MTSGEFGGTGTEGGRSNARERVAALEGASRATNPIASRNPTTFSWAVLVLVLGIAGSMVIATDQAAYAAGVVPDGFEDEVVIDGRSFPTTMNWLPDGRLLVAEKSGRLWMYDSIADDAPDLFADLSADVHNWWDRGLLGLAIDPGFPAQPYVYVQYTYNVAPGASAPIPGLELGLNDACPDPPGATSPSGGCVVSGRLSRLTVSGGGTGNTVVGGSELVLIEDWCAQFPSHSVGTILFGPDGNLYAAGGDGASFSNADWGQWGLDTSGNPAPNPCGDPMGSNPPTTAEGGAFRSQDLLTSGDSTELDGAVIRIDRNGAPVAGNPRYGDAGADLNAQRILAIGLRNPFRFTFRPGTSELWIGDVGWGVWEEIDVVRSTTPSDADNFGWPCYEGPDSQGVYQELGNLCGVVDTHPAGVEKPWLAYHHDVAVVPGESCPRDAGSAISGVAFETGGNFPSSYDGALFFTDFNRGCMWVVPLGTNGDPDQSQIELFADLSSLGVVANQAGAVDLKFGPDGSLYWVEMLGGRIHRIRSTLNASPIAVATAKPTSGQTPLVVQFEGSASYDPDGDPLTYAWDLDGDGAYDDAAGVAPKWTYNGSTPVNATLRVTDPAGASATDTVLISPQNTPPTAVIQAPTTTATWAVGDRIAFSGRGTDAESGALPPSALTWTINILDCQASGSCSTRFVETFEGSASGSIVAADWIDADFIEIALAVTDPQGLADETSVRIAPRRVDLTIASRPPGVDIAVGETVETAPFTRNVIVGSATTVIAPASFTRSDVTYDSAGWSDDPERARDVIAPETSLALTAVYQARTDAVFVDTNTGIWHMTHTGTPNRSFYYGNPGDYPMMGDWDCSGEDTPGLYRQSDGYVYLRNSNTQGIADTKFFFGNPQDIPLAGDFNGDGCDTVSVYRPSEGRFFIINELGENNGGLGAAEYDYYFGDPGDKPFVGDVDGDGIDEPALHRESTGLVYFRNTHTTGIADGSFIFGDPGDVVVFGDWANRGIATVGAFRPSDKTLYVRFTNSQGVADSEFTSPPGATTVVAGAVGRP
ncbi:MAG: PQQ-dependent sugar dehydrogenase [Acidimicrobiia bacterium]